MATEVKTMDVSKQERPEKVITDRPYSEKAVKKFRVREWIEEVKHEIRVINWTSREELQVYTQIVVGATFVFGMGVYFTDLAINGALNILNFLSRAVFG